MKLRTIHLTLSCCKLPVFCIAGLLLSSRAGAQDSARALPSRLSISLRTVKANPFRAFDYPLSKTIDYKNYPLTAGQILARESQINVYNRVYNLITNKNKNGFIGNIFGLQRVQRPHASPSF